MEECTGLDLKLAESCHSNCDFGGSSFRAALKLKALVLLEIGSQKNYGTVLDQMATYHCLLPNAQTSTFLQELKKEAADVYTRISNMVKKL